VTRSQGQLRARVRPPFAAALAALALALACSEAASEPTVTGEQLEARLEAGESPLLLDVRTPEEFAAGRVPGAVNIPHTELPARLGELRPGAREREVVVYCERGGRAETAEAVLRTAGFSNVRHLEGDMRAWRNEQRPCEGC
jgi:rhodanese-related sulfurtransferase